MRNYDSTGDTAGQNMTSRATRAAMVWITKNFPDGFLRVQLTGGIETDKKHSSMSLMHSRGKRVIAEATIPREVLVRLTRAEPADLFRMRLRSITGSRRRPRVLIVVSFWPFRKGYQRPPTCAACPQRN